MKTNNLIFDQNVADSTRTRSFIAIILGLLAVAFPAVLHDLYSLDTDVAWALMIVATLTGFVLPIYTSARSWNAGVLLPTDDRFVNVIARGNQNMMELLSKMSINCSVVLLGVSFALFLMSL